MAGVSKRFSCPAAAAFTPLASTNASINSAAGVRKRAALSRSSAAGVLKFSSVDALWGASRGGVSLPVSLDSRRRLMTLCISVEKSSLTTRCMRRLRRSEAFNAAVDTDTEVSSCGSSEGVPSGRWPGGGTRALSSSCREEELRETVALVDLGESCMSTKKDTESATPTRSPTFTLSPPSLSSGALVLCRLRENCCSCSSRLSAVAEGLAGAVFSPASTPPPAPTGAPALVSCSSFTATSNAASNFLNKASAFRCTLCALGLNCMALRKTRRTSLAKQRAELNPP
mmetsp:Transcript_15760/g.34856  ORF Transcript_15760/g.34856 Transcript_15760/m.34856 type:complete len:285 (-) Transcript_15760:1977-2831(-)